MKYKYEDMQMKYYTGKMGDVGDSVRMESLPSAKDG
jgi:hypothetical protein